MVFLSVILSWYRIAHLWFGNKKRRYFCRTQYFCTSGLLSLFPFLFVTRGLSDHTISPFPPGSCWDCSASLTAVVLIGPVPAVIHAIAMQMLRQALGDVPTGKMAQGALDILSTPMRNWDEERGEKVSMKALQRVGPPIFYNHLVFPSWHAPP